MHIADETAFVEEIDRSAHHFLRDDGSTYTNDLFLVLFHAVDHEWMAGTSAVIDFGRKLEHATLLWELAIHKAVTPKMVTFLLDHIPDHGPDATWEWLTDFAANKPAPLMAACLQHQFVRDFSVDTAMMAEAIVEEGNIDNLNELMPYLNDQGWAICVDMAVNYNMKEVIEFLVSQDVERTKGAMHQFSNTSSLDGRAAHGFEAMQQAISLADREDLGRNVEGKGLSGRMRKI